LPIANDRHRRVPEIRADDLTETGGVDAEELDMRVVFDEVVTTLRALRSEEVELVRRVFVADRNAERAPRSLALLPCRRLRVGRHDAHAITTEIAACTSKTFEVAA